MQLLEDRDYFTDHVILKDPYAYFEAIRAKGPIYQIPSSGLVVVTGFDEILEVLKNTSDFSSVIAPSGPAAPLPFQPQGPDITPQIEAHRTEIVGGDLTKEGIAEACYSSVKLGAKAERSSFRPVLS